MTTENNNPSGATIRPLKDAELDLIRAEAERSMGNKTTAALLVTITARDVDNGILRNQILANDERMGKLDAFLCAPEATQQRVRKALLSGYDAAYRAKKYEEAEAFNAVLGFLREVTP